MKTIPLSQGLEAFVSDGDYERLNSRKWFVQKDKLSKSGFRAASLNTATGKFIFMHRFVLSAKDDEWVIHYNGDHLDNRRCNLKSVSRVVHMRHSYKHHSKSGYLGVYQIKKGSYYVHIVPTGGKSYISVGSYSTPKEAAMAYDTAARIFHGHNAVLNFPKGNHQVAKVLHILNDPSFGQKHKIAIGGTCLAGLHRIRSEEDLYIHRQVRRCKACAQDAVRKYNRKRGVKIGTKKPRQVWSPSLVDGPALSRR